MSNITETMWEELKKELFMNGREGLEDFLDFELPDDFDKDVVENQLNKIKEQMPQDILIIFYKKYVLDLQ